MFTLVKDIHVADVEDGLPALLTMILMPLTYDITVGIGAGFISWVLIKVVPRQVRRDPPADVGRLDRVRRVLPPGLDPDAAQVARAAARPPTHRRAARTRPARGRRAVDPGATIRAMFERTALPEGRA